MPHEIVWVDKVLNPRSAVLTHNEALNILKNAKSWTIQPRSKAAPPKSINASKKMSIAQQKEEYIQLRRTFAQQDEIKPIFEMKAELESLEKSKVIYSQAIQDGVITPFGLPRLKPSASLRKEMKKSKKSAVSKTAAKLSQYGSSAINKEALKKAFIDDDEDVIMEDVENSRDSKDGILPPKNGEIEPPKVIVSDSDDDEDMKVNNGFKEDIPELEPLEPNEATLQRANNPQVFASALDVDEYPSVISFEADKGKVNVIASTITTQMSLEDAGLPTNVQFTDEAISSVFNPPVEPMNPDADEALRTHFFGESSATLGSKVLEDNLQIKLPSFKKSGKASYTDLLKDDEFREKLLHAASVEWNVAPYIGVEVEDKNDEEVFDHLPSLKTLNSLFSLEDMEILRYQASVQEMNQSRLRHRQRTQHPIVKLRPKLSKEAELLGSTMTTEMVPKTNQITTRITRSRTTSSTSSKAPEEPQTSRIPHNTMIHEALKYLNKSKTSNRTQSEIKEAYKKLSKYPLTFLEKINLIHTTPKDSAGMLCMLDDLGLRFDKETMEDFEKDCSNLFPVRRQRSRRS